MAARSAAAHWWPAVGGEEQRPHRLQRWFGAAAFLTLVPQSYSGRILSATVRPFGDALRLHCLECCEIWTTKSGVFWPPTPLLAAKGQVKPGGCVCRV